MVKVRYIYIEKPLRENKLCYSERRQLQCSAEAENMSYLSCVNGYRLPLCTTEEIQQLKIQGTLLQFEES